VIVDVVNSAIVLVIVAMAEVIVWVTRAPPNTVITDTLRKDLVKVVVKLVELDVVVEVLVVEVDDVWVVVEVVEVTLVEVALVREVVVVVVVMPGVNVASIPIVPLTSGLIARKAPLATSNNANSRLIVRIEVRSESSSEPTIQEAITRLTSRGRLCSYSILGRQLKPR
jgi:hypothetical protein